MFQGGGQFIALELGKDAPNVMGRGQFAALLHRQLLMSTISFYRLGRERDLLLNILAASISWNRVKDDNRINKVFRMFSCAYL